MDTMPARYSIAHLLDEGVQPFNDLDDEQLTALSKGIARTKLLAVPVVITSDGLLIDGHQRLRAMRMDGRTYIDASDVRIVDDADSSNALEWAVRLNVQRRQLTVEEKAEVARRLQAEHGWSQRKIAELFGVSQPAVSQWLNPPKPDGPKEPGAPRGPRMPTPAVLGESKRLAAEVTNPAMAQWIVEHVEPGDRDEVVKLWQSIALAAGCIVESLTHEGDGVDAPGF
jgi:ParB/RepB/Spo0J family partition protein